MADYVRAQPLFMTPAYFAAGGAFKPGIGTRADYEERAPVTFHPGRERALAAAEHVFHVFQNIDENHMCPDVGRSMMCGDLVELTDSDGNKVVLRCATVGFDEFEFEEEIDD